MSSGTLKIVAIIAVILAVVLAVVGYRMSSDYAAQAQQTQQQADLRAQERVDSREEDETPKTLAVVAVKALAAYAPIERDAVALVPVAVAPIAPIDNIDDVVGKIPLVDIDVGAPVTARYFRDGSILARVIPEGHLALSVEVSDVVAVGGFVRPGDIVDVLMYIRGGSGVQMPQSRILLQKVRVLAYQERIIDRPEGVKDDDRQRARSRTAVLAIPEKDTTRLMLGVSVGELRLALHGEQDEPPAVDDAPVDPTLVAANTTTGTPSPPAPTPTPGLRTTPDQVIGLPELARMQKAAAVRSGGGIAPKPKVEIYRGSSREVVTTQ